MALIMPPGNESRTPQRVAMYWPMERLGSSAERVHGPSTAQAQSSNARGASRKVREPLNNNLHRVLQLDGAIAEDIEHDADGFNPRRRYARREDVLRSHHGPAQRAKGGAVLLPAERECERTRRRNEPVHIGGDVIG